MSESDPTGYGDSPDTADGPVEDDQQDGAPDAPGDDDATLTTDSEAQRDDSVMRPGNEPD
jgi:hypothetical protein